MYTSVSRVLYVFVLVLGEVISMVYVVIPSTTLVITSIVRISLYSPDTTSTDVYPDNKLGSVTNNCVSAGSKAVVRIKIIRLSGADERYIPSFVPTIRDLVA